MKPELVIVFLIVAFILSCGCNGISTCVPVHVDAKYPSAIHNGQWQTVIIDGESYWIYNKAYSQIRANETYRVRFETNFIVGGTVVNSVCGDKE